MPELLLLLIALVLGLPTGGVVEPPEPFDLGEPPAFAASQLAADAANVGSDPPGCSVRLEAEGRMRWLFLPATCAGVPQAGIGAQQGTPAITTDDLKAATTSVGGIERAITSQPTYVCTNSCDRYTSTIVTYRIETSAVDGYLVGTIPERDVPDDALLAWLDGVSIDLDG